MDVVTNNSNFDMTPKGMLSTVIDKTTLVGGTSSVLGIVMAAPDPHLVSWIGFVGQCFGAMAAAAGFIYVCIKVYYKIKHNGKDGAE